MSFSVVVAVSENWVIGRDGRLPWHLPADLDYFRRLTTGHTLVMGRKTFESIGKPLPERRSIVVSRSPGFSAAGVEVAASLQAALELAADDEVFVIGGGEIFKEAVPAADRLYLTLVHGRFEGDVHFSSHDLDGWQLCSEQQRPADERNAYDLSFKIYQRP
ncbi:MAG: dihydrofolate reductase [Deltaproteobacteria bacterium]|jgi:dihydrofolate reductase